MQKRAASPDGTRINYDISRVKGCDRYLVFAHGAGGDLTAWRTERAFFHRQGIPTVAIDLRGHGGSDRPRLPEQYALERFAEDIAAVLRKERIRRFVLVGHCFGGMVTVMFHKLYPEWADAYILVDTTYKAPGPLRRAVEDHPFLIKTLNHLLARKDIGRRHFSHVRYADFKGTGDWNLRRILSDIAHTSLRSWLLTYEAMAHFDGIAILRGMRKRVLVVEGERDSVFSVPKARRIHRLVRHSELDVIPGGNHVIVLSSPRKLERDVCAYLYSIGFAATHK